MEKKNKWKKLPELSQFPPRHPPIPNTTCKQSNILVILMGKSILKKCDSLTCKEIMTLLLLLLYVSFFFRMQIQVWSWQLSRIAECTQNTSGRCQKMFLNSVLTKVCFTSCPCCLAAQNMSILYSTSTRWLGCYTTVNCVEGMLTWRRRQMTCVCYL